MYVCDVCYIYILYIYMYYCYYTCMYVECIKYICCSNLIYTFVSNKFIFKFLQNLQLCTCVVFYKRKTIYKYIFRIYILLIFNVCKFVYIILRISIQVYFVYVYILIDCEYSVYVCGYIYIYFLFKYEEVFCVYVCYVSILYIYIQS